MSVVGSPSTKRRTLRTYLDFVKFEHTLFALPFAYGGMLLAERGWPGFVTFFWVTLAMVGARTASMALNRVIDAEIDARNPRTAGRAIPSGTLSKRDGLMLAGVSILVFGIAGLALNPLTLALLPVAVLFLTLYPYTKRFTWLCHYWLGATIGASAAGGWIAVTGSFAPPALSLWAGVGLWIAGFDIIYAMLDYEFDRRYGIKSVPAAFGLAPAAAISGATHLASWVSLALTLPLSGSGWLFGLGLIAVGAVLLTEHRMIREKDVGAALKSFNANLYIGLIMLAAIISDIIVTP